MSKAKQKQKGDALVNKVALIVMEVICLALIFGYLSDLINGAGSVTYVVVFEIAAIATAVTVPIVYKVKPKAMKYVAFIMFAVVFFIANIGATTDVAFVMAFPIVVVFILYYDFKLILAMAITFSACTIFDVIYIVAVLKRLHSGSPINSSVLLMESLATVIYLIAVTVVTSISNSNNAEKIGTIQAVSNRVNESIRSINGEISALNESSDAVKTAMEEINSGITNTAEAVQNQLLQTESIQEKIESVENAAENISQNVETTMSAVEEGNQDVERLVEQSEKSVSISTQVTENLNELKESVNAMGTITQMIENVAFQTNIMALNANVEAAHAGEAGRGFAVVATEISNMSSQTKQATDDITELIANANNSLDNLVESIEEMEKTIQNEKTQTEETSAIFASIAESTKEVSKNVTFFMDSINGLAVANKEIVQSVSTISATTEEVTALANEALQKEENNAGSVHSIAGKMDELARS